ncbi:unnamed protein product [Caretta caretta]
MRRTPTSGEKWEESDLRAERRGSRVIGRASQEPHLGQRQQRGPWQEVERRERGPGTDPAAGQRRATAAARPLVPGKKSAQNLGRQQENTHKDAAEMHLSHRLWFVPQINRCCVICKLLCQ